MTNILINIFIIYIFMFCFVAGGDGENEKIWIACEGKQWCFTLNKEYEVGNKFYSLLENKESLIKRVNFNAELPY